jgi:hypothetical protein
MRGTFFSRLELDVHFIRTMLLETEIPSAFHRALFTEMLPNYCMTDSKLVFLQMLLGIFTS